MPFDRSRDVGSKALAVDSQRRAGGNTVKLARSHDERSERAHLLVKQADRIVLRVVGAEAVRANHLCQAVGLVRRRTAAAPAHFAETDPETGLCELPRRFAASQSAADDMDVERHARGC